jgi:1-aminocyclopropane-1-carboxylate deaminase
MFLPTNTISFDKLKSDFLVAHDISVTVLRLDKIHNEVSGNKLFKLHYFVEACLQTTHKTMLTFGGAFSNHLVATAFLCKEKGIQCIGVVRGEAPKEFSHTLLRCKELGMHLHFISRADYKNIENEEIIKNLQNDFGECTMVPEGGYSNEGAKGASLIMDILKNEMYSYVCTCVGTATTLSGLLMNNEKNVEIIAVPVIKNMSDIEERIQELIGNKYNTSLSIFSDYHFGGYAKYNTEIIAFMNTFYTEYTIPTDFVYTAKMMFAIFDKIKGGYFPKGSKIVCLHTGGLQGNTSLPAGTLIF